MIRIITDSASDITQAEAKNLGIDIIPMKTRFNSIEYKDGLDIGFDEFYNLLAENKELPTTSCPSPVEFEDMYNKYPEDEIICITISSKLSGTYQSAMIGKDGRENVRVIDSLSVSPGERILVYKTLDYIKDGLSLDEIEKRLNGLKSQIVVIALLETLENLKKGGRISSSVATVGSLLGIKPLVTVNNGEVEMLSKARGFKKGQSLMNDNVEEHDGINYDYPFFLGYAGNDDTNINSYIIDNLEKFKNYKREDVIRIGSSIGTHVGAGAIALAYIKNK